MSRLCKNCSQLNIADLSVEPDTYDGKTLKIEGYYKDAARDPKLNCDKDSLSALIARDAIALESSAQNGCRFCAFIFQTIHMFATEKDISVHLYSPVRLKIDWSYDWSINRSQPYDDSPYINWPRLIIKPWGIPLEEQTAQIQLYPKVMKPLSIEPLEEDVVKQAKAWISECQHGHSACSSNLDSTYFPPRLIELDSDPQAKHARLIELKSIDQIEGVWKGYVALSYCWGDVTKHDQHITLKSNIEERLSSFNLDILPKTIEQAALVCQHLGYRHLWVDSLCIIQDHDSDVPENISHMHEIYKGAVCTISALEAKNATDGMLCPRTYATYQAFMGAIPMTKRAETGTLRSKFSKLLSPKKPSRPNSSFIPQDCHEEISHYASARSVFSFNSAVDNSQIEHRGWTFQERLLSRRRLCFSKWGLFWECHELSASEQYPDGFSRIGFSQAQMKLFINDDRGYIGKHPGAAWQELMHTASDRYFTNPRDRLKSLAGIAREFAERNLPDDTYLAGLWRSSLLWDLCWGGAPHVSPPPKPPKDSKEPKTRRMPLWDPEQPTWSWAAQCRRELQWPIFISYTGDDPHSGKTVQLAQVLECNMQYESPENIWGNVLGGSYLLMSGYLGAFDDRLFRNMTGPCGLHFGPREFIIDTGMKINRGVVCFFVLLRGEPYQSDSQSKPEPETHWALLLTPDEGAGQWRRVGLCLTHCGREDFAHGQMTTIKLM